MFHLKPDVMKKLQLKKEVIASLERRQTESFQFDSVLLAF